MNYILYFQSYTANNDKIIYFSKLLKKNIPLDNMWLFPIFPADFRTFCSLMSSGFSNSAVSRFFLIS